MTTTVDRGQVTFSFDQAMVGRDGPGGGHEDGLRIQLYWPYGKLQVRPRKSDYEPIAARRIREVALWMQTCIRVSHEVGYWGIGIQVLGFGGAMDWQRQKVAVRA